MEKKKRTRINDPVEAFGRALQPEVCVRDGLQPSAVEHGIIDARADRDVEEEEKVERLDNSPHRLKRRGMNRLRHVCKIHFCYNCQEYKALPFRFKFKF